MAIPQLRGVDIPFVSSRTLDEHAVGTILQSANGTLTEMRRGTRIVRRWQCTCTNITSNQLTLLKTALDLRRAGTLLFRDERGAAHTVLLIPDSYTEQATPLRDGTPRYTVTFGLTNSS